ncbi:Uncharacterised protein [Zhongshania aliphaticivorans]|uniref:Uncharacterized protein n=1 Tax=Zhongshania aliphaticivorans TaxID=1470434 RepID=A0A5S9P387_9GAMM|nr:hypothetical protein [Zhongshania aliphaticivorans]CAA0090309.1 Uncharacterised protein [Zhongshania aliphaticivorans]CAA0097721.1 Uncharacterised protein [Zhongshania aliphaticivorans]
MNVKNEVNTLLEKLKTERDELNVRMHLAGAEVRDEWQALEKYWDQLKLKGEHLQDASEESAKSLSIAAQELGNELKEAYQRIGKALR